MNKVLNACSTSCLILASVSTHASISSLSARWCLVRTVLAVPQCHMCPGFFLLCPWFCMGRGRSWTAALALLTRCWRKQTSSMSLLCTSRASLSASKVCQCVDAWKNSSPEIARGLHAFNNQAYRGHAGDIQDSLTLFQQATAINPHNVSNLKQVSLRGLAGKGGGGACSW